MDNDQKFLCFIFASVCVVVIAISSACSFSNYLDHKNPIPKNNYCESCNEN